MRGYALQRMLTRIATPFGIALLGIALLELTLQLLALGAPRWLARTPAPGAGEAFRILCIGDSHTYGWDVERSEAYPARLEQLLDEGGELDFEVVNLGVPASNSSQLVTHLPRYLAHYRPQLLVVTIGGNDVVNLADRKAPASGRGLQQALWGLRSWRLLVYALHQREKVESGQAAEVDLSWSNPWRAIELRDGLLHERYEHRIVWDAVLDEAEHEALLRWNLREIVRIASIAGVPVVFASYTHDFHTLAAANRVMGAVAGALFVSQRAHRDLRRYASVLATGESLFFKDLHPKAPLYAAAAAHLRDELLRERLIPR